MVQINELVAPERVMPTRLGNVLRAAEDRAGERYGLDTVVHPSACCPVG